MRYRITHRTAYTYADPAHESFNEVRLRPVSGETQTCLDFMLSIDPPATVSAFKDYYGNDVHDFGIPYLHDHLSIEATSDVVTFAAADQPLAGPREGEPDRSPALAGLAADPDVADEHAEFLIPSAYVVLDPESERLARALLTRDPAASAHAFLRRAASYVRENFAYEVGATNVQTTVAEVIAGGRGVCQDFAHLLISICRHAGLPARYASGYLGDVRESAASHAWVEAWAPPYGWVGFDPTAGAPCTGRHVKVAVGRDYADVTVVRGTYRGGSEVTLDVSVKSAVLDDARELAGARGSSLRRERGAFVQYQTLGAMKQMQRLGAMTQKLGAMTQTLAALPDGASQQPGSPATPRQQPQQQQQIYTRHASPGHEAQPIPRALHSVLSPQSSVLPLQEL